MRTGGLLKVVAFVILLEGSVSVVIADQSLVLHYRFDQDQGTKVVDHSSYKNDGLNTNGQFMEEVRGHHGVMRFDGEKSVIEATGDSLQLKGDFTCALWVRLNDIEKHTNCIIFRTSQYNFSLAGYVNLGLIGYSKTSEGDNITMEWPVDRDILGTDWSHITVVVAYPRVRFYRNGQLIRDAWMPFSMESSIENGKTIRFGSDGRFYGFVDLDEAMFFNRALSPREVSALAMGADVAGLPTDPHAEILMEPFWYEEDRLTIRFSAYHQVNVQGQDYQAKITLTTPDGKESSVEVPCTPSRAAGTARAVAAADFSLKDFANKAFRARVEVHAADGKVVDSVEKDFLLEKPKWVHNRKGLTDVVPKPWTPVEVKETAQGSDILVWGRRYRVADTPFFAAVESKRAAMLAKPMTVNAMAKPIGDGVVGADTRLHPVQWIHEKTEWARADNIAATFVQTFSAEGMVLEITGHTEYDGFVRFDCKIKARQNTELSQFFVEIPVVPERALYAYAHNVRPPDKIDVNGTMRTDYSHMNQSGLFKEDMAFPFTCEASLADDERMLVWQAESPEGWNNQDEKKAIEFLKEATAHTLRIRFIDQVTVLQEGDERTLTFALLATPTKPMTQSAWDIRIARSEPMVYDFSWPDRTFEGKPALDHVAEMGIRGIVMMGGGSFWPHPLPLGNEWWSQQIKRNVQAIHDRGLKTWTYMIHVRSSLATPEFEFNGAHMAKAPFKPYATPSGRRNEPRIPRPIIYGVESNSTFNVCPQSQAVRDANVYALHKRLEYFSEDGFYWDGPGYGMLCKNTKHGCGYLDNDGKLRGTRPIFGTRKYIQRAYVTVKSFGEEKILDQHGSFGLNTSAIAYGDTMGTGERWHHFNTTYGGPGYVAGVLPLDIVRHEFTCRQHNVPFYMHTHRLGDYVRISATTLLLDVPAYPSVDGSEPIIDSIDEAGETIHHKYKGDTQVFSLICRVRDQFGIKDAKRILYYEGVEEYATIAPTSKQCYTTLFIHPTNGVLAFVTNRARDGQSLDVTFNLDALGLAGKELEVLDTMYNRQLSIGADGSVSLKLKSEHWTYLWLKPMP